MSTIMMNSRLTLPVGHRLNGSVIAIGKKGESYAKRGINKATRWMAMIPGYMVLLPYAAFVATLLLVSVVTHVRGN